MTSPTRPDVTEMTAVHRVFRNAFAAAPGLIEGVADGDTARSTVVGGYLSNVLEFLRVHHSSEDELIFPRLVERAADPELVTRIGDQHHDIDHTLERATSTLAGWITSASVADGKGLIADLAALEASLIPHLDQEETDILALVQEHITVEEWSALPGHALGAFKGDNVFLILGLVREQFTPEQNVRMLEGMPAPAAQAWKSVGIDAYKATVATLIGKPA